MYVEQRSLNLTGNLHLCTDPMFEKYNRPATIPERADTREWGGFETANWKPAR